MIDKSENLEIENLVNTIKEALLDMKAKEVVGIQLSNLPDPICDHFIIAHGDSSTHVNSLASNVVEQVKKINGIHAWHKEGYENAQWILLDFANVVVHIFQQEYRSFYNLEGLWADAEVVHYEDDVQSEMKN